MQYSIINFDHWINPDPSKIEVSIWKLNDSKSLTVLRDVDTQQLYFIGAEITKFFNWSKPRILTRYQDFNNEDCKLLDENFLTELKLPFTFNSPHKLTNGLVIFNEFALYSVITVIERKQEVQTFRDFIRNISKSIRCQNPPKEAKINDNSTEINNNPSITLDLIDKKLNYLHDQNVTIISYVQPKSQSNTEFNTQPKSTEAPVLKTVIPAKSTEAPVLKTVIPAKSTRAVIDIKTLTGIINKETNKNLSTKRVYGILRQIKWVEKNSPSPTRFSSESGKMTLHPYIITHIDGRTTQSIRTVIYEDIVPDLIKNLKNKQYI